MKKLLLLLLISQFYCLNSQDSVSPRTSYTANTVYEKVYLHVDREMYAPGEDIWFKVYLLSGLNNSYLQGYKNVYIQLLNDSGQVVASRLILAYNGSANGDIQLNRYLEEGQYTLRAHTLYQKNFGEESSFLKKIWISKLKEQQKVTLDTLQYQEIDFTMYPESGNLILEAPNYVAFKATGPDGYGLPVTGYVIDDTGDTISPLSAIYHGMGKFALMPIEGRSYHVILDQVPGKRFEISDIQKGGITLQFKDEESRLEFALAGPLVNNYPDLESSTTYFLTAEHKGITLLRDTIRTQDFYTEFGYPKSGFPLGISKFTLKDEHGSIIAERLVFVQAKSIDYIRITTDSSLYHSRSKVNVKVEVDLEEGDSIKNGLSMAVVNRDYLYRNGYENDIRSFLLLDSELKGYIESPASFFVDDNITSSEKLDLLMMVHGWRTYYWPDILKLAPGDLKGWNDVGVFVKGHLKKLFGEKPVPDCLVKLGPFSASFHYEESYSDENGVFSFERLYLKDSAVVIIKADMAGWNRFTEIFIDSIYTPLQMLKVDLVDSILLPPSVPNSFYSENYSRFEAEKKYAIEAGIIWLDEVEVITESAKSFSFMTPVEAEAIYGIADYSFEITNDDMSYTDIYDFLESRVPGVLVMGNSVTIRGGQTPAFMIDGVINDLYDPAHIPMGDIAYIEIIKNGAGAAALGSRGADGIIAIYTRTGEIVDIDRYVPGRIDQRIFGFNRPRQYFSQKYTPETLNSPVPDFRPTLHWEPYLDIEEGIGEAEFYTSDFKSEYLILLEGITKNGRIYSSTSSFRVK